LFARAIHDVPGLLSATATEQIAKEPLDGDKGDVATRRSVRLTVEVKQTESNKCMGNEANALFPAVGGGADDAFPRMRVPPIRTFACPLWTTCGPLRRQ
jgi:hypothetical protein